MKKLGTRVLVALIALAMVACGGKQEEEKTVADKKMEKVDPAAKKREEIGFHAFDKDFQIVAASFDGVIRGVDMYATMDEVKAAEGIARQVEFGGEKMAMPQAELAEETADALTYNLKMEEREDAEINYHFADGKLNSITIAVHVADDVAFEALEEEFIQYFTHKHGEPTAIEGRKEVWKVKGSDTHEIDIIDKQNEEKYYLEVVIK